MNDQDSTAGGDGPEMFERDVDGRLTPVVRPGSAAGPTRFGASSGRGRVVGLSLPGAIAGAFLVGSMALGAGAFGLVGSARPSDAPVAPGLVLVDGGAGHDGGGYGEDGGESRPDGSKPGTDGGVGGAETEEPSGDAATGDDPGDDPGDEAGDEAGDESASPAASDEAPGVELPAEPQRLGLDGRVADGIVRLDWGTCASDLFMAYKVVRSKDASVAYPARGDDDLVAVIEDRATSAWRDREAPAGATRSYRVFGVTRTGDGWAPVCASRTVTLAIPKPEPTPEPTATPDEPGDTTLEELTLTVDLREGHPKVRWSACASDRFDYYKVVLSADATVSWPAGDNDRLEAAIGNRDETAFWDTEAPAGKTLYYRVFCVDATEAGYAILGASGVRSIETPSAEPAPDPVVLAFEVNATDGGVRLHWQPFAGDGFVYYKVVRSHGDNPSYLPWTDGTELIGVVEDQGADGLTDGEVSPGDTWSYRVQAVGYWGGEKVVLGQTAVITVTVP